MRYLFLSFSFDIPLSCTSLCRVSLFVSENSKIIQRLWALANTGRSCILKEGCFAFGIIHVGQLKTIVIKFWISSRVFCQQNNKLINWKRSLIVALKKYIARRFEKKIIIEEIAKIEKKKRIKTTSGVAVITLSILLSFHLILHKEMSCKLSECSRLWNCRIEGLN